MNDYILRDTARRIIDSPRNKEQMLAMLDAVPSADVQPVRHGHWILDKAFVNIETYYYRCSECGNERCFTEDYKADWCEECGARMDGE